MNSITFVCSRVGGGKSFIGKSLFKGMPDSKSFVEVSDIVRDIIKKDEREHLVNKPELSGQIIEDLKQVQSI